MNIKDQRALLREMDRRLLVLLKARIDLAVELDNAVETQLGLDPLCSADSEVLLIKQCMRDMQFDADKQEQVSDFLVHYMR